MYETIRKSVLEVVELKAATQYCLRCPVLQLMPNLTVTFTL